MLFLMTFAAWQAIKREGVVRASAENQNRSLLIFASMFYENNNSGNRRLLTLWRFANYTIIISDIFILYKFKIREKNHNNNTRDKKGCCMLVSSI